MRLAQAALVVAQGVFGFGELDGGCAARLLGLAQLVQQPLPALGDLGRQLGQLGHFLAQFAEALMQGADLLLRAAVAAQPALALGGDGFEPHLAGADLALGAVGA